VDRRRFLSTVLATAGASMGLAFTRTALGRTLDLVPPLDARPFAPDGRAAPESAAAEPSPTAAAPSPIASVERGLPLPRGTRVADCVVDTVGELRCGVVPVVLRDSADRRFQVDVARRDFAGPAGIGNTRKLSLYLANGGSGRTPTEEAHGLAVLALAARLGRLERAGARWPELLTMRQRDVRHPDGAYQIC
jgi:hypothetical protein